MALSKLYRILGIGMISLSVGLITLSGGKSKYFDSNEGEVGLKVLINAGEGSNDNELFWKNFEESKKGNYFVDSTDHVYANFFCKDPDGIRSFKGYINSNVFFSSRDFSKGDNSRQYGKEIVPNLKLGKNTLEVEMLDEIGNQYFSQENIFLIDKE